VKRWRIWETEILFGDVWFGMLAMTKQDSMLNIIIIVDHEASVFSIEGQDYQERFKEKTTLVQKRLDGVLETE
jgi:hypothetical protein